MDGHGHFNDLPEDHDDLVVQTGKMEKLKVIDINE
jgi:hypothetical protein